MLDIQKTVDAGKAEFALIGRLDTVSAPQLEGELQALLPGLTELTLDLKQLDYISSAGLRVLLSAHKAMLRQGTMTVKNPNEVVAEIFDVTGFSGILNLQ